MLAETVKVDVPDDPHLVIIHAEERIVQRGVDVGSIAARQDLSAFSTRFGVSSRPSREDLAQLRQQLPDDFLHPRILYRRSRSSDRTGLAPASLTAVRRRRTATQMRCMRKARTSPARGARSGLGEAAEPGRP